MPLIGQVTSTKSLSCSNSRRKAMTSGSGTTEELSTLSTRKASRYMTENTGSLICLIWQSMIYLHLSNKLHLCPKKEIQKGLRTWDTHRLHSRCSTDQPRWRKISMETGSTDLQLSRLASTMITMTGSMRRRSNIIRVCTATQIGTQLMVISSNRHRQISIGHKWRLKRDSKSLSRSNSMQVDSDNRKS